jgi:hypothetical protein
VNIPKPDDALGRLAGLVESNDRLAGELRKLGRRQVDAELYLDRPGCNAALGNARLAAIRDRRRAILARLRANRIEAREFLSPTEAA